MFFGKAEKKRCHPCLIITVGVLTAIGVVALTSKGKCLMSKMKSKIGGMLKCSDKDNSDECSG